MRVSFRQVKEVCKDFMVANNIDGEPTNSGILTYSFNIDPFAKGLSLDLKGHEARMRNMAYDTERRDPSLTIIFDCYEEGEDFTKSLFRYLHNCVIDNRDYYFKYSDIADIEEDPFSKGGFDFRLCAMNHSMFDMIRECEVRLYIDFASVKDLPYIYIDANSIKDM